jgi:hypothetical protein
MQQTASRQSTPARINSRSAPDCPLKERFSAQLSCFDTIPGCVQKTCIEREDTLARFSPNTDIPKPQSTFSTLYIYVSRNTIPHFEIPG